MSKEAMKLALEALETERDNYQDWDKEDGAPEYIYEAITALREALAKPAQPKYRRGDRLTCLETEEYCVIHISGTDRQWVKFPTSYIGVYTNEQVAELFELLPKEPEQEPVAVVDDAGVIVVCSYKYKAGDKLYTNPPAQQQEPVSEAWDKGYQQGVQDERTSEANIGIAGFGAKVEPARQNPYGTSPPAQRKPLTDEQVDAEFDAFASKFDHESNEWLDMGVDAYFRAGFKAAHGIKENT